MESDVITNDIGKYKQTCSRLGCHNKPTLVLEVAFLQKKGRFCEFCAGELLKEQLVRRLESYDDTTI